MDRFTDRAAISANTRCAISYACPKRFHHLPDRARGSAHVGAHAASFKSHFEQFARLPSPS